MKTRTTLVVVLLVVSFLLPAGLAHGRGADVPRGSILSTKNLGILSTGIEFEQQIRGLVMDSGQGVTLDSGVTHLFMSIDIFKWLTIQGGAGGAVTKVRQDPVPSYTDFMWNAGMKVGLWQHDVADPTFLMSRLKVQLHGAYYNYEFRYQNVRHDWKEGRAALTVGADLFANRDFGLDKKSYPYSLGLYLGPYFTTGDANGVRRNDQLGGLAGLDLYISHNFSLGYEIHLTDTPDHLANLIFHF